MNRWRFYQVYGHMLWALALVLAFLAAIALFIFAACGCSGNKYEPEPKAPQAVACLERGVGEMLLSTSCRDALESLRNMVRTYPECAEFLTPTGAEGVSLTLGAVTLLCDEWKLDPNYPDGGHE